MPRQNCICPVASNYSVPVAVGAVAFLYNVSRVAANCQDILSTLPSKALQFPLPLGASDGLAPFDLSGYHYFATNTTPVFNLNASPDPLQRIGNVVANKVASSPAPMNATKGVHGIGNGAVDWLYLKTTKATQGDVRAVYRVNTAGGNLPKTCESSDAVFSVQYAALYWFYSQPGKGLFCSRDLGCLQAFSEQETTDVGLAEDHLWIMYLWVTKDWKAAWYGGFRNGKTPGTQFDSLSVNCDGPI
jgi:hypothetical protein